MKFTGSLRHLFERVDKKRIPHPPNRSITGATTGVFILLTPLLVLGFGVRRVRAMKNPARFPGPGLGTLLKDIFLYLSSVSTSRSQKLHRGHKLHHAEVVFGIPRNICWAPHRWRPSNETKNSNVPCRERGLCSDQLPLFQGVRFSRGRIEL